LEVFKIREEDADICVAVMGVPAIRRRLVSALAAGVWALSAAPALADPPVRLALDDYVRRVWTTSDGLPQNSVRSIVQSAEGHLWLATSEGLTRFDGARMTVIDRQSSPALPSPNVSAVLLDRAGHLWLALKRDGVVRLGESGVEHWTRSRGLPGTATSAIAEDGDGTIWVCTDRGPARLRAATSSDFEPVTLPGSRPCSTLAVQDRVGVWIGTPTGAFLATASRTPQPRSAGLPAPSVTALVATRSGTVLAGTPRGVARFSNGVWEPILPELSASLVTSLIEDRSGAIWIAMLRHGIARLAEGRLERLMPDGPRGTSVLTLFEDREGTMWAGLTTGGLMQLRPTAFSSVDVGDGLPTEVVRAVLPTRDGALWVGTAGSGLARYHKGGARTWTRQDGLPSDFVFALVEAPDGRVWVGTSEGLALATDSRVVAVPTEVPGAIRVLRFGRDGRLRVGSRDGLFIREADGTATRIAGTTGVVRAVLERADGAWWMAGLGGLFQVTASGTRRWTEDSGLPDTELSAIHENPDGSLWVATLGQGLFHFDGVRATRFTSRQGLFDDTVFQLVADRRGWLWMMSNRGLFRARLDELSDLARGGRTHLDTPFYGQADGLPANEFNGGSTPGAALAPDGMLWFASIRGAVRADPRLLPDRPVAPPALVEAVLVDGRPHAPGTPLVVPPGPSRLEIQYSAQTLLGADRVRFRYRLGGFEDNWVEAGLRRAAYYTNLPPGTYRFEVMASRDGVTWSAPLAGPSMTLEPRFYQTGLFAALSMIAGLLVVLGGVRWRERRRAAREHELEDLVARRTRELEEEITERKRAAEALEIARAQALQASELKSEFLANVSHEIRTPMNGVIGMTDLALEMPLPAEARRYLDVARSSADLLLQVINDVLDFSKIEAGKLDLHPVALDLRDELDEIVTLLAPRAAARGLALGARVGDDVPALVTGDPVRLRQILLNLVGNALKFTELGSVTIGVTRLPHPDDAVAMLRVAVTDTGVGIAPADQARIFEAFTQVDGSSTRRHGGTGLGLAIAAQLVELMGGELSVTSARGEGSTFAFTACFPVAGDARADAGEAADDTRAAALPPLHVLVAEDNPVNRLVVQHMLHRGGHRVTVVTTGREAVDAVAARAFDVVLMDVQMPEMNGLEATAIIRATELGRRTPIIGITAHALRGDRERCLESGMDDYLAKPVSRDELNRVLTRTLAGALVPDIEDGAASRIL
jgi:signal transduction histidine kinase/ligand-binding sensor domain-containing protein/ActR/RegA family two-component response regulator